METKVFYHGSDFDGIASAYIIKSVDDDAKLIPIDYGIDPIKNVLEIVNEDDAVFMVDFSLPIELMKELDNKVKEFFWIDHHIGAIDLAKEHQFEPFGLRSPNFAACKLTWQYFNENIETPKAIELLEQYDRGRFTEDSIAFQMGMRSFPHNPEAMYWKLLLDDEDPLFRNTLERGAELAQYAKEVDIKAAKDLGFESRLLGYKVFVVNSKVLTTFITPVVFDPQKYDFLVIIRLRKDKKWELSFRKEDHWNNIDLRRVAQFFGGGGHLSSSGAIVDIKTVEKIINGVEI